MQANRIERYDLRQVILQYNTNLLQLHTHECYCLITVDGEWSEWSSWETCSGFSSPGGSTSDRCLCRSRSCDQPKPRFGGLSCFGERIQVTNCSGKISDIQ